MNHLNKSPQSRLRERLYSWLITGRERLILLAALMLCVALIANVIWMHIWDTSFWPGIGWMVVAECVTIVTFLVVRRRKQSGKTKPTAQITPTAAEDQAVSPVTHHHSKDDDTVEIPTSKLPTDRQGRLLRTAKKFKPDNQAVVLSTDQAPDIDMSKPIGELSAHEALRLARMMDQHMSDETVYWHKNPHIKHFLKRSWRLPLAAIGSLSIAWFMIWVGRWDMPTQLTLVRSAIGMIAPCIGVWYCLRRIRKWQNLYLVMRGNWLYVEEAESPWFLLNGSQYGVPIIACNNIKTKRTKFELVFKNLFSCGTVDINSPIDKDDVFRALTDVRDFEALTVLLKKRYDELMTGATGVLRREVNNP